MMRRSRLLQATSTAEPTRTVSSWGSTAPAGPIPRWDQNRNHHPDHRRNAFSDFQLGEAATKTWDGGAGTVYWADANNWNPDGVPASTDDVSLTGANTIDINTAGVCNNITLNNASLVLTIKSAYSLTVRGNLTSRPGH